MNILKVIFNIQQTSQTVLSCANMVAEESNLKGETETICGLKYNQVYVFVNSAATSEKSLIAGNKKHFENAAFSRVVVGNSDLDFSDEMNTCSS